MVRAELTTVRPAKYSEAEQIAATLARAFSEDPVVRYFMRNAKTADAWRKYFRAGVDLAFAQGEVWTSEDLTGACLFFAPHWRISLWTELAAAWRIARATSIATMLEIRSFVHALEKAQPSVPHYYLLAVGVLTSQRRRGLGAALMQPILERCVRDSAAAYLENSNPANRSFYERHGFERTGSLAVANNAPPVELMWRP